MANIGRPTPPLTFPDWQTMGRVLGGLIRSIMTGKMNNGGTVTLTANDTTTTVTDDRVGANTRVILFPTSSTAAADIANTYVSAVGDGSFTITHSSTADSDKSFSYLLGG